jgi:hypothetical protein
MLGGNASQFLKNISRAGARHSLSGEGGVELKPSRLPIRESTPWILVGGRG